MPKIEKLDHQRLVKHGYVHTPPSRAYWCRSTSGSNCGPIGNEPQSVEGPKGFPTGGPPDGQLASGGNARFSTLDGTTTPNGQPWPATQVKPGGVLRLRWWLTAPHRTAKWHYWITKDGWNPEQPLSRGQLELMTEIDWSCPGGEGWRCNQPVNDVHHFTYLPATKQGRHVLLGIWDVGDTVNAFYQAIDLDFGAGGE